MNPLQLEAAGGFQLESRQRLDSPHPNQRAREQSVPFKLFSSTRVLPNTRNASGTQKLIGRAAVSRVPMQRFVMCFLFHFEHIIWQYFVSFRMKSHRWNNPSV
jgi:hypothetical protein